MKNTRIPTLWIFLFLAALACNFPVGGAAATPGKPPKETKPVVLPTAQAETAAPTASIPPLTADMLRGGTYVLPESKETVTLVNGKFDRADSTGNILHVVLMDPIAFGDLNGDGAEDAAIVLSENMGGTGFFMSVVAVLNQGGAPVQSGSRFLDDRAQLSGMTILHGRIAVDAVIHGVNDPMCCPNFPVVETLRLQGDGLILVRFTSRTPDGGERAIAITGPSAGSPVSGSVQLSGTVTIAPFENTLAYEIFGGVDSLLAGGSIMVNAADMGAPGTFNVTIDLAGIPAGTTVRLEVSDLSAADGSLLAMDSVELRVE